MLIQPVLRPVLQPVLRSILDPGIGGGGTPIWTPASLFENGEQGALYYFTDDFAGLYQDAAGLTPVTAVEQPVGFILDKRLGLARSPLSIVGKTAGDGVVTVVGNVITVTGGTSSTDVSFSSAYSFTLLDLTFSAANSIVVYSGGYMMMATAGRNPYIGAVGIYNIIRVPAGAPTTTITVHDAYNIIGNYARQYTVAARPVLKETGTVRRINFDGVDDKLTTTFPNLGSNVTIARSVPGVGASILTGQTIGAGAWDDSTNHCGLVIVNRALTGPETASLTAYLNELAGV